VAVTGEGVGDLLATLDRFEAHARSTGQWERRRLDRARREVEALAVGLLRSRFRLDGEANLTDLAVAVRDGRLDPYAAAEQLVGEVSSTR